MNKVCSQKPSQLLLNSTWIFFLSSILHFLYSFTGFFPFSYISAVNESVWEHVKIIFFSVLIFDLFLYFKCYKGSNNFFAGLTLALFSIIISVPFMFYGYTGIIGRNFFVIDLLIAYIAGLISQYILNRVIKYPKDLSRFTIASILLIVAMTLMFFIFTWYPPDLPLFVSPV